MGINLGAGIAPIICGSLRQHLGFRYGFIAAGIAMLIALVVFLSTQAQVLRDVEAAGNDLRVHRKKEKKAASAGTNLDAAKAVDDEAQPRATGIAGVVGGAFPIVFMALGAAMPVVYYVTNDPSPVNMIMPTAFGILLIIMGNVLLTIKGAARDKSIVIFGLFIFAVLFWMAFEQASTSLTFWAADHTDLHLPLVGSYPAEWWQFVNAGFIVLLGPVFSAIWVVLAKKKKEPSTPAKMFVAMLFIALSFGVMVFGAQIENGTTTRQTLTELPAGIAFPSKAELQADLERAKSSGDAKAVEAAKKALASPIDAGRLRYDASKHELEVDGVLPSYVVEDLLSKTAPKDFAVQIEGRKKGDQGDAIPGLEELSRKASKEHPVTKTLENVPEGFKFPLKPEEAKEAGLAWDEATHTLTMTSYVETPVRTALVTASAPPSFREPLTALQEKSQASNVSGIWLLLSYLFATLGELCLSPVGLSMVTKLAPLRFAALFMGVWMLSSAVAQYFGGSIAELWGRSRR